METKQSLAGLCLPPNNPHCIPSALFPFSFWVASCTQWPMTKNRQHHAEQKLTWQRQSAGGRLDGLRLDRTCCGIAALGLSYRCLLVGEAGIIIAIIPQTHCSHLGSSFHIQDRPAMLFDSTSIRCWIPGEQVRSSASTAAGMAWSVQPRCCTGTRHCFLAPAVLAWVQGHKRHPPTLCIP